MATIFISYNRKSEVITKTLIDDMQELGYTIWFDHEISGGQQWWDKILAKIRECDVFLFVTDQESLNSTACKREYSYAADLGKSILPVLVSEEVHVNLLPPELSAIQFVDYRTYDTRAVLRLARALGSLPSSKPLPDPLPAPPEIPVSYLGSLVKQLESDEPMSFAGQSAMLIDLKRSYLDPETTGDARKLLEVLRKRQDLLATVAREIDELLDKKIKATSTDSRDQGTDQRPTANRSKEPIRKKSKPKKLDDDSLYAQLTADNDKSHALKNIIVGTWTVQISQILTGSMSSTFTFSPNGTFSGQLFSAMGIIPVQGQWTIQSFMLSLRGYQTLMFMNYPYSADITFMTIFTNRLEGNSQAGESILMTR